MFAMDSALPALVEAEMATFQSALAAILRVDMVCARFLARRNIQSIVREVPMPAASMLKLILIGFWLDATYWFLARCSCRLALPLERAMGKSFLHVCHPILDNISPACFCKIVSTQGRRRFVASLLLFTLQRRL